MKSDRIFKKSGWELIKSAVLPILFTVIVLLIIGNGLRQAEASSRAEGLRILDDSIRRAVVTAYAIEGRYPESLHYIEENFGIHIDRERFIVHYRIFAPNLMPEIVVIER